MDKQVVLLDSDGVLTDIASLWAEVYNERYNDNLQASEITIDVDLVTLVKPECGEKIYEILHEPGMFACMQPLPGAVEACERLCANPHLDVHVLTDYSGDGEIAKGKLTYFKKHFPFLDSKKIILCKPKHLVCGWILVDDKFENLAEWSAFQSAIDVHDHHTILIGNTTAAYERHNRVDLVVPTMVEAADYIENLLL